MKPVGAGRPNGLTVALRKTGSNPTAWAASAIDALRHHIDLKKFPKGAASLESFDTAEELFWGIFPDWRRTGL
jgi:hypothetical protein